MTFQTIAIVLSVSVFCASCIADPALLSATDEMTYLDDKLEQEVTKNLQPMMACYLVTAAADNWGLFLSCPGEFEELHTWTEEIHSSYNNFNVDISFPSHAPSGEVALEFAEGRRVLDSYSGDHCGGTWEEWRNGRIESVQQIPCSPPVSSDCVSDVSLSCSGTGFEHHCFANASGTCSDYSYSWSYQGEGSMNFSIEDYAEIFQPQNCDPNHINNITVVATGNDGSQASAFALLPCDNGGL